MNPETIPATPVILRNRLSHEMAYPVGYEFLREHFGVVVDSAETRLRFRAHPTAFASEFAEVLRTGEPYPILRLDRNSQAHPNDQPPAHWEFIVCPVVSRLRSAARAAFVAGALAEMQDFVACCPTHWNYHNSCFALFDPAERVCKVSQLHPFTHAPKSGPPASRG